MAVITLMLLICSLIAGCSPPVAPITLAPTLTPSPLMSKPVPPTPQATRTQAIPPTPSVSPSPFPSPTPRTYVVRKGDVLGRIARDCGVALEALAEANDIENPNELSVGQVLLVPVPTATVGSPGRPDATARPSPTSRPAASPTPADKVVYITGTDGEYHREGCTRLEGQGLPITCQEALQLGYRPCRLCNPRCR